MRLAVHQVPLLDRAGQPIDVLAWLREQGPGHHHRFVAFEHDGCCFAGRLLACSVPQEAAERARSKERKRASKQQRQVKEETLYLCGWLLIFTTVPEEQWSDEQVLALYRARWQIELVIKRMKQVLKLAQLRGKSTLTNEATVLAVLVAWSVLQGEVSQAREWLLQAARCSTLWEPMAGEPSDEQKTEPSVSSWTVTALHVQTVRLLVQGYWTMARLRACLPCLGRYVCSRRRQREHQETSIRRLLLDHLGAAGSPPALSFSCSSP